MTVKRFKDFLKEDSHRGEEGKWYQIIELKPGHGDKVVDAFYDYDKKKPSIDDDEDEVENPAKGDTDILFKHMLQWDMGGESEVDGDEDEPGGQYDKTYAYEDGGDDYILVVSGYGDDSVALYRFAADEE